MPPFVMNSSFSISRNGARKAVLKALKEDTAKPPGCDQQQIEAAKALVTSQVEALAAEFNGVQVLANGEWSAANSSITVQVSGLKLDL